MLHDWKHRVWVYLDSEDWHHSAQVVRDFRSVSRVTLIGQAYWTAHGLFGLRSLLEMGGVNFVVDARLSGDPDEMYAAALSLFLSGAGGVTVHPIALAEGVQQVVQASHDSLAKTQFFSAPPVFVSAKRSDRAALRAHYRAAPTDLEYIASARKLADVAECPAVVLDCAKDLIAFDQYSNKLVVPLSKEVLKRRDPAGGVLSLMQRDVYAALVPTRLVTKTTVEHFVDSAVAQLDRHFENKDPGRSPWILPDLPSES